MKNLSVLSLFCSRFEQGASRIHVTASANFLDEKLNVTTLLYRVESALFRTFKLKSDCIMRKARKITSKVLN
jgi:hypothetical protein